MRREAEAAQLVVVNHHLFFADLALRGPHPARVIPDYDAVIFDEAHQLEDIATDFFGMRVSRARIERLLGDAERALTAAGAGDPLFNPKSPTLTSARAAAEALWAELGRRGRSEEARFTLERDAWVGQLEERYHVLDNALEAVGASANVATGRVSLAPSGAGGRTRGAELYARGSVARISRTYFRDRALRRAHERYALHRAFEERSEREPLFVLSLAHWAGRRRCAGDGAGARVPLRFCEERATLHPERPARPG